MDIELPRNKIVLFDGVCNFCNGSVNFIIDRDKKKKFLFAALQSNTGKKLLHSHQIKVSENLESVILIKNDKVYEKSAAVLEIAKEIGGFWKVFYIFKIIPTFISDFFYDLIAKNRYRFFGKEEACRVPESHLKERFLD